MPPTDSDHGPSIKCPDIYDALRAEGMDKEKAAKISNAACKKRKSSAELTPDTLLALRREVGRVWAEQFPHETPPIFAFAEGDLPDTCFGYVPEGDDAKASDRKLPLCKDDGELDAAMIGAAAAALGEGFRGERVDLPEEAMTKAKTRVLAAWRKVHPDKEESDAPDSLVTKTAAEGDPEKPSRDYLAALKAKLAELIGVSIGKEDWDKAHRHAMASAGGKGAAKKRRETLDASELHAHIKQHPAPVESCQFCMDYYGSPMTAPILKLAKADERVNYREAGEGADGMPPDRCYGCRFYQWGSCNMVEGSIEAEAVCDLYLGPVKVVPDGPTMIYAEAGNGGAWRLFNELPRAYADAPDWIQVLPIPGVYDHPVYGSIVISPERNANFVANFDNRVYQQDLPITLDLEHDGKMSGAQGVLAELRMAENGGVEARVEWTDRGKTLIEEDAFRYFSPEWFDQWRDPVSGDVYQDVLVGGALTVRPFFKESVLRPLVASEGGGLLAPDGSGVDPSVIVMRPMAVREYRDMHQLTDEQFKEFTEAKAKVEANDAALKAASEKVAALEAKDRERRFRDLVMGKSGATDGAPWIGPIDENVASLERMAVAFGEDSDEFKAEVTLRQENAKRYAEAGLFKPKGSAEGNPTAPIATNETDRLAQELIAANPNLSYEDAVSRVFAERRDLYEQHRRSSIYKGN